MARQRAAAQFNALLIDKRQKAERCYSTEAEALDARSRSKKQKRGVNKRAKRSTAHSLPATAQRSSLLTD